ncbi:hypothetical protein C0992_006282 [Termitomyces sp. T32_za158]|nr:hypothetical protein C0992_006282 [Termitomyces sp. T32_za158]
MLIGIKAPVFLSDFLIILSLLPFLLLISLSGSGVSLWLSLALDSLALALALALSGSGLWTLWLYWGPGHEPTDPYKTTWIKTQDHMDQGARPKGHRKTQRTSQDPKDIARPKGHRKTQRPALDDSTYPTHRHALTG